MRVIHIACIAPPEIGGIGSVALREVSDLRSLGVDARLIVPEVPTTHHAYHTLRDYERSFIHRLPVAWRFGNASVLQDWKELITTADLIHLHYPYYGFQEQLLLSDIEKPIVMTYHMDASASSWKGLIFKLHRLFLQSFLARKAKAIIVSSFDYLRASSLKAVFQHTPDTFVEIPFGIDTNRFSPGLAARERFGIAMDDPTLLFVGGLDQAHAFKGLSYLFQAMAGVDASVQLLIVGDGDKKQQYMDEVEALGLRKRIHFLGRLPDEEMPNVFRSADAFVFPSVSEAEAFGLVALEAQASGIPVIASALPGVRTVVKDGETGILVPPKDVEALRGAIQDLLTHKEKRLSMGVKARVWALRYGHEKHAELLWQLYKRLCESH